MLAKVHTYCQNAKPVVVRVPVNKGGSIHYYSKVIMSPCGKCEHCRRVAQNHWSSRLYNEARNWTSHNYGSKIFFCTFTISNEWFFSHADELEKTMQKDMPKFVFDNDIDAIQRTPVAKYIYNTYWKKRLLDMLRLSKEKRGVGLDLKYYTCCEFGDRTERIHFHSILYIKDFKPIKEYCLKHNITPKKPWYVKGKNLPNNQRRLATLEERYLETLLDRLWSSKDDNGINQPIGMTNVNLACAKSFRYITKYVCKLKEDEDYDKCPFHRQSAGLGLDLDSICDAILNNKPYYEIKTATKTYKCSISKYYRKKYQLLLGVDDIFTENWLKQSNRLYAEHKKDILQHNPKATFIECDENGFDFFNNDLEKVVEVYRCTIPTLQRKYHFTPQGRKVYDKEDNDYIWITKDHSIYYIMDEQVYLNGMSYDIDSRSYEPNYAFEEGYTKTVENNEN